MADQAAAEARARRESPWPFIVLSQKAQEVTDKLNALWIDRAPRFGAVATHFPESLRKRRFVASFWAPEVLLFGWPLGDHPLTGWYVADGTRPRLDEACSLAVEDAAPVGALVAAPFSNGLPSWHRTQFIDTGKPRFWSPELPEVLPFDGEGNARAAAGGWRDVCVYVDPVGHRRIAHRLLRDVSHA